MAQKRVIAILVVFIIAWIWYFQYRRLDVPKENAHNIDWRTGDLILFKNNDNFNALLMCSYITHIGVIIMYDDIPMVFEAIRTKNHTGIQCTPLHERLKDYRGKFFYKKLKNPIHPSYLTGINDFVDYCCNNMFYDTRFIGNAIMSKFLHKPINEGVNCGELCFITYIRLGLLPVDWYFNNIHLNYFSKMISIETLVDNELSNIKGITSNDQL